MVEFVLKCINQRVKMKIGLIMGCKFDLSVVMPSGGSQTFQAHIRTQNF